MTDKTAYAPVKRRAPITPGSPCVGICRMNRETGLCDSCLHTLDEIAAWSSMDAAARAQVMAALPARGTPAEEAPPQRGAPR